PSAVSTPASVNQSARSVSPGSRHSTQAQPSKRVGSAAPKPDVSRPAIGCPPTYPASSGRARTSSSTGPLTEVTSVTSPVYPDPARRAGGVAGGGGGPASPRRPAPAAAPRPVRAPCHRVRGGALAAAVGAIARVAGSASYPSTECPATASARSNDPPISPSPT